MSKAMFVIKTIDRVIAISDAIKGKTRGDLKEDVDRLEMENDRLRIELNKLRNDNRMFLEEFLVRTIGTNGWEDLRLLAKRLLKFEIPARGAVDKNTVDNNIK